MLKASCECSEFVWWEVWLHTYLDSKGWSVYTCGWGWMLFLFREGYFPVSCNPLVNRMSCWSCIYHGLICVFTSLGKYDSWACWQFYHICQWAYYYYYYFYSFYFLTLIVASFFKVIEISVVKLNPIVVQSFCKVHFSPRNVVLVLIDLYDMFCFLHVLH